MRVGRGRVGSEGGLRVRSERDGKKKKWGRGREGKESGSGS